MKVRPDTAGCIGRYNLCSSCTQFAYDSRAMGIRQETYSISIDTAYCNGNASCPNPGVMRDIPPVLLPIVHVSAPRDPFCSHWRLSPAGEFRGLWGHPGRDFPVCSASHENAQRSPSHRRPPVLFNISQDSMVFQPSISQAAAGQVPSMQGAGEGHELCCSKARPASILGGNYGVE